MKKAALFLALCAASFAVGCDDGNGPGTADDVTIGTDIGPDSDPYCRDRKADGTCPPDEDVIESSDTPTDSAATEDEATNDPCANWAWAEGTTWRCQRFDESVDCTMRLWVETDDQGADYCLADCDWFSRDVNVLQWGPPPPTSFVLPASGPRPDSPCNLMEE